MPSPTFLTYRALLKATLVIASLSGLCTGKGIAAETKSPAVSILGSSVPQRATLLAIDDYSLPLRRDLNFYLSKPTVRREAVLTPNRSNPHATDTM